MGRPLVENTFDFGMRSPAPEHLKLLDFLAVELVENDWSLQHIIRLVISSRVYSLSSRRSADDTDEEHQRLVQLFGRAHVRRLDAEAVRDSLLAVAGTLDRQLSGPDIPFVKGQTVLRRSLYFQHAYEKQMTMLVVFDAAAPTECYRRSTSVVPQQALALANSPLALDQARLLARRFWPDERACRYDATHLSELFRTLYSRLPTDDEVKVCLQFVVDQEQRLASQGLIEIASDSKPTVAPAKEAWLRARESLVHVLVNHNDFITLR
jgi:hypothetical protein